MSDDAPLRILVVEDELAIQRGLLDVLAFHGFAPEGEAAGDAGLRRALAEEFALVILDVMLPGRNGFDVCSELREARPELPILMLTARGSEEDVLRGFACGSDDYVTKPFSVAQLVARVQAILRRSRPPEPEAPATFPFGPWQVDRERLRAEREGLAVELTRREVDLLALLGRDAGRIVSRRTLLREVWGFAGADRMETRTVDMHVAKLRKKLGDDAPIETVRGEGYRYPGA
jgi:two-component system response regulator RegX3